MHAYMDIYVIICGWLLLFRGRWTHIRGGVYGDLISSARMREDARTICPEQLASDIMADDVYLLYAYYNIANNVHVRGRAHAYMNII